MYGQKHNCVGWIFFINFFYFSGSGLQLFIAKDGTTTLGSQDVKCHMPNSLFKQVVMEDNR